MQTPPAESAAPEPPAPLTLGALDVQGIVIIHADTLRADHLPAYGYGRDTTPTLDGYGWSVVVGDRATGSWTLPSTASFLTSLEPEHHGMVWMGTELVPLSATTWPERLQAAGWATALYSGNRIAGPITGLDRGEDVVHAPPETPDNEHLDALLGPALGWLDSLDPGTHFALMLQPMDMHSPYLPSATDLAAFRQDPIPFSEGADGYDEHAFAQSWLDSDTAGRASIDAAVTDLYDADLLGLDRGVGALLHELDNRGLLEHTLVVFSADHGESLDDNGTGGFGHMHGWREEEVNIPLMLLNPGLAAGEQDCLASNMDVWPTIAAAIGLPPAEGVDGVDLGLGCRELVRGSHWQGHKKLSVLAVATTEAKLTLGCTPPTYGGTVAGPDRDPTEQTPLDQLPNPEELKSGLDAYTGEVVSELPETRCGNNVLSVR